MKIHDGARIWQVSAGDTNRNYVKVCLEWDVMLNGNGDRGPWPECESRLRADGVTSRKLSDLRRFCGNEVKPGDIVLLRLGTSQVHALGVIPHLDYEYQWLDDFGDVDGWDLQHVRRVNWLWSSNVADCAIFDAYTLKLGDTFQELSSPPPQLLKWIEELAVDEHKVLKVLPKSCVHEHRLEVLGDRDLPELCSSLSVTKDRVDEIASTVMDILELRQHYVRNKLVPSESDTVTHFVVPLLMALGWKRQSIALEWHNTDLGLFESGLRKKEDCSMLIEAKRFSLSCLTANRQAQSYVERGLTRCRAFAVTDGIRYGVFGRTAGGSFSVTPSCYMNLNRLVQRYPVLGSECSGFSEVLRVLMPVYHTASNL